MKTDIRSALIARIRRDARLCRGRAKAERLFRFGDRRGPAMPRDAHRSN